MNDDIPDLPATPGGVRRLREVALALGADVFRRCQAVEQARGGDAGREIAVETAAGLADRSPRLLFRNPELLELARESEREGEALLREHKAACYPPWPHTAVLRDELVQALRRLLAR